MSDDNNGKLKPINETVRALSGTPMLLVLAIINLLVFGMVTYLVKARAEQMHLEKKELLEALHNCLNQK